MMFGHEGDQDGTLALDTHTELEAPLDATKELAVRCQAQSDL